VLFIESLFIILYATDHLVGFYLHVLLVILLFQIEELLGPLAGFIDLLHGSLVLKLKQADSVPELHYVFLDPIYDEQVRPYITLCLWACSSMYPV